MYCVVKVVWTSVKMHVALIQYLNMYHTLCQCQTELVEHIDNTCNTYNVLNAMTRKSVIFSCCLRDITTFLSDNSVQFLRILILVPYEDQVRVHHLYD